MKKRILIVFSFFSSLSFSQSFTLSTELKEISGLEFINDSTMVALNDGGNSAHLYVLNKKGKILKKVLISNAMNSDWEDIAADDDYIYIGDIGNNLNKRKDLRIYRVSINDVLKQKEVIADEMQIAYSDQKEFPPALNNRNFDSECLISANGYLWVFSKNNSDPFDGNCKVYRFKFIENTKKEIELFSTIYFGNRGFYFDTPTAGDFSNGEFYITTYNRWLVFKLEGTSFKLTKKKKHSEYNQKEALTVQGSNLWVANEYNKLLGKPKLKRITLK
jgi:hypothetical protein